MNRFAVTCASAFSLAWLALGCAATPVNPQTFNFELPNDVAFLCLDMAVSADGNVLPFGTGPLPIPVPISRCQTDATGRTVDVIQGPSGMHSFRIFAIVTQRPRGEIAVVNLHPALGTGIIDHDLGLPGYTFVPVGPVPVAVAVDPRGTVTYVASYGDQRVTFLDNVRITARSGQRLAADAGSDPTASQPRVFLQLPAPPQDLAVVERPQPGGAPSQVFLYVTLPSLGQIAVVDVSNPRVPAMPVFVNLASMLSRPAGADGGAGGLDGAVDAAGSDAPMGGGEAGAEAGVTAAQPQQIAVGDDGTLYVTDSAQSWIHTLTHTGMTLTEGMPLDSGRPTVGLAVTPTIPRMGGMERWVYAIGRSDAGELGRVVVMDAFTGRRANVNALRDGTLCDPSRSTDNCRRLESLFPFDQIPLVAPASAIAIVTRGGLDSASCSRYTTPAASCAASSEDPGAAPSVLRGMQAVVTLRTGQVQVIDIDDPDHDCVATRTFQAGVPPFQQHLPRGAFAYTQVPGATAAPTIFNAGSAVTPGPELPHVVPLTPPASGTMCSADNGFCCSATNGFCISLPTNPLAVRDETWNLVFEGVPPGLRADGADFHTAGVPADQVRIEIPDGQLCTFGALPGDRFTVLSLGPYTTQPGQDAGQRTPEDPAYPSSLCLGTFGGLTSPCNRDLDIVRVTQTEVIARLRAPAACSPAGLSLETLRDRLVHCYPQTFRYEIHVANAWTVSGSRTGYRHDVVAGADGVCARTVTGDNCDPTRLPAWVGRAVERQTFCSPALSFRIDPGTRRDGMMDVDIPTPFGMAMQFQVVGGYTPYVTEVGASPEAATWLCPSSRLYVVDPQRNALREFTVAPFTFARLLN